MRKRYQQGSVTKSSDGRYWIGKYREGGRHKTKLLGKIREITKSKALKTLQEITKPLNERAAISPDCTLKSFIESVYFPFYQRKWKTSTLMTNKDRIQREIVAPYAERDMRTFTRDELQSLLDSKSCLSFSSVDHTVRFKEAVYVLHAFQKKSTKGIKTAQTDVELMSRRLKTAKEDYEERDGKAKE